MDLATASESADEWEPCSGDGFIHKRKRRRIDPSSAAPSPADSGVAEEKFRRDRRKKTLLGVKGRYQRELALWEKLSVTCRAKQGNVEQLPREREGEETDRTWPPGGRPEAEVLGKEDGLEAPMGGLLLEVIEGFSYGGSAWLAEKCRKQHWLPSHVHVDSLSNQLLGKTIS